MSDNEHSSAVSSESIANIVRIEKDLDDLEGVTAELMSTKKYGSNIAEPSIEENAGTSDAGNGAEEKPSDGTEAAADENNPQVAENASLRGRLRALIDSGKHYLQCTALAPLDEYHRQISLYKELAAVQLRSFSKELLRSSAYVIADGAEGLCFKLGELKTCPLEMGYTGKFVTHAGFDNEQKKFSFGYKRFGKNLPSREIFNPIIKKCYEAVTKYAQKSGRPFHVLRKKPPGFWSAVTIMCNKKKELLLQVEVHVSVNQYKRQLCELEKLKFLNYFTEGLGKDCNVFSLQWKEYMGQGGFMNQVLFGKEFLIERFCELNLRLYPDDHLFSKPSGVELVCRTVKELLDLQEGDPKVIIFEVGTGTGIVGMQLSKVCKRVHMLDRTEKGSTEHAEENVKLNGIPNCFVHHEEPLQVMKKIAPTLSEDDKLYAVLHNNTDTKRVAPEIEGIAAIEKIKKLVYLSFDHKVRSVKHIRSLCSPANDPFVPVKVNPLVIIPCYSDVELAVLLVRKSLLEGNTVENEFRQPDEVVADEADKNKEDGEGGNDDDDEKEQSDSQEPPNKKMKPWKQQANDKKGKQKFKKMKRLNQWERGNRWIGDDEWEDEGDMKEMNIRKVGFPGYKPPSLLSEIKSPPQMFSKKPYFQQNDKWSRWQQNSQSWGQSNYMNQDFQYSQQNYDNWYSQYNRYQEMDFDSADVDGYQDNWRGYQQYGNSRQQYNGAECEPFNNSSQNRQQSTSRNQQYSSSQNQQYNSSQNQQNRSSQNQQYNSSQHQQQKKIQNQQQQNSQNQQQNNSQKLQQQTSQNQQYSNLPNQQCSNLQNQQYNNPHSQQYSNPQTQQYNNPQTQQYSTQNQQQYNVSQNQQSASQTQQYSTSQNQLYYNTQIPQFSHAQNPQTQQFNSHQTQTQQFNSPQTQAQQFNSPQTQPFNSPQTQTQQLNNPQTQQFSSPQTQAQQLNISQTQQLNNPQTQQFSQQQQFNNSQQKQFSNVQQQQQLNSSLQINYDSSFKPTSQQSNYDISAKSSVPQTSYDASVKSDDSQQNYVASDKSGGSTRRFLTYGVDYSSMQQTPNYGAQSWVGQQSTSYPYGYGGSGSSMVPGFNASTTSNLQQQNSWTPYLPQTKLPTGNTNPN